MIVVVILMLLFQGSTEAYTPRDDRLDDALEKQIQKLMRKQHLPGFAITIVDDQQVLYQQAFGLANIENNIQASTGTVFRMWSVSKLFTALEIFREVEEGLVNLDAILPEYLPGFSIQSRSEEKQAVTVKSVLAHRSGLPRNKCVSLPAAIENPLRLEKCETAVADCFLTFPEGSRYHYSNLGYDLLGRIIEEKRGEGFAPYMKKHMFEGLGMNHTTFSSADLQDSARLASGYEFYKGKFYPVIRPDDISSIPSGNLYSTMEDMSLFLTSVFNQKIFAYNGTMPRMFKDHFSTPDDPETMGLGWKTTRLDGADLLVWHDGGPSDGTGSLVSMLPSRKLGIALMGNGTTLSGSVSLPFAMEIFRLVLDSKKETVGDHPPEPEETKKLGRPLEAYEGSYAAFGQLIEVKAKSRKLKGKIGGLGLEMIPEHDSCFRVTHWLDKTGLTRIFKPPIDFDQIHITFCNSESHEGQSMIINLNDISFELCPRYPDHIIAQGGWEKLVGEYRMADRLPENKPGPFTGPIYNITAVNHTLVLSGVFGPVVPVNDHCLEIMSGPFAGETIEYDPATGFLIHQNAFLIPAE